MSDEATLPEDDRDLILARQIGERLKAGALPAADDAAGNDASFYGALLAARAQALREREAPDAESTRRTWSGIAAITRGRQDRQPERRVPPGRAKTPVRPWVWWSAAASLLMAGVIYVLVRQTPSDPRLLASAGTEIGRYEAPDGSVVTLRPHSALFLVEETEHAFRYRLAGEAFFDVTERPERQFVVQAGTARVVVLGTRFNVSTWGNHTSVYLEEGRILFEHTSSGASAVLIPGQWSRTEGPDGLQIPLSSPSNEHLDWLSYEMHFQQRPVRLILAELEQHYQLTIRAPDSLVDQTMTGRILLENARQSLEDLGQVMGGRFVSTRPNEYRFESD